MSEDEISFSSITLYQKGIGFFIGTSHKNRMKFKNKYMDSILSTLSVTSMSNGKSCLIMFILEMFQKI